jgi:hypothetical protein
MNYQLKENEEDVLTPSRWDLDQIVLELRALRTEWRQNAWPEGVTYELPSKEVLSGILEGMSASRALPGPDRSLSSIGTPIVSLLARRLSPEGGRKKALT